ncbi:MAG: adenine nucleotide alpha hydrolase family protein [Crenarchaeota archaeon]|nr:adenine nucleotide alpha hydrolase family protein [Thermoproteota archaeon]
MIVRGRDVRARCTFCNEEAIYIVKHRKLRLCREHFIDYVKTEVENTIYRFEMLKNVKKLLIAVSGGKDSVTMLHILHQICRELGTEILGLTIDTEIGEFSRKQVETSVQVFKSLGIPYRVERFSDYGIDLLRPDLEKITRRPPCSVCGIAKRYIMNRVALEENCQAIATGHNMIDIAQYAIANILTGSLEYLTKLLPKVEEGPRMARRLRPLYFIDEKETKLYVETVKLPYVADRCPLSDSRETMQDTVRALVRELEDRHPGSIRSFVDKLVRRIIPSLKVPEERYGTCKICGMPSKGEVCSFCRIRMLLRGET